MKALLLAAGLGTRLRPITNFIPKCLVPIHGKILLEYWLENLSEAGVSEFLINTSYLSSQVEDFVQNSEYRDKITLIYEEELLNTGGTLLKNRDYFENEPFMLVHADNLSLCDFRTFIDSHTLRDKNCEMSMMLFQSDDPSSCGIVELKENIVVKFHEKVASPPSNLANAAVYICEPTLFDFLQTFDKEEIDFSLEVLPEYMGRINTFVNTLYHRDIGTLESYGLAQVELMRLLDR